MSDESFTHSELVLWDQLAVSAWVRGAVASEAYGSTRGTFLDLIAARRKVVGRPEAESEVCPNCWQRVSRLAEHRAYEGAGVTLSSYWTCEPAPAPSENKKARGLYNKFTVTRTDGKSEPGQKHADCEYFVLDLTHDKFAPSALRAYARACSGEYPFLAEDLLWKCLDRPAPVSGEMPVAMTPELSDLLDSIMAFADVDPDTQVKQIWRKKVAAVRAQAVASPMKFPKVRDGISLLIWKIDNAQGDISVQHYSGMLRSMLAELDAAEGVTK